MEFDYQAKSQSGAVVEGKIEAPNEDQAVTVLHQKGLVILSLAAAEKPFFSKDLMAVFNQPGKKDVVMFTRQLATLVDADVPVVEGLHALAQQVDKESFHKVINSVAAALEGGASLSVALAEHDKIFTKFYVSLVKAGEVSGKLHSTLLYLADYLEKSATLNSKIKGALSYPAFVVFAIVVVSTVMVTMVLPQLLSILKESGATELPATTKILIIVSDFVNSYIILILFALVGGVIGLYYYLRSDQGRGRWQAFELKMPQFGRIFRNFYIARLGESLSTLIKSGVPILDGLSITAEVVGNETYKRILLEARTNVQNGGTISEVFAKYDVFPALLTSMLAVGEKTGRTDFMLDNVTRFYKSETENNVQNLTQLIEPVLILVLGLAVGILVSAILLPIYSLVGA
ncbi:MAG: type II secretion system F family protein [Patescibacteria group bacterium]